MRRSSVLILLVAAMLFMAVPVVLAYTAVEGQVNDAYGDPWTHGGTVDCVQDSTGISVGSGTINPDGSWSVPIGSPSKLTCTIDPAAGPSGDPEPYVCNVPPAGGGGVQVYSCEPGSTNTGPNAVSLSSFTGAGLPLGAGAVAAVSALVGSALIWRRRR